MFDIEEACRMLDTFASVGACSFVLVKLDLEQNYVWHKTYSPMQLREKLLPIVRTAAERKPYRLPSGDIVMTGENVTIRPAGLNVRFVQLDDLKAADIEKVRSVAFLIHQTSPNSSQAWISVNRDPATPETKVISRSIRKALGAGDDSATGSTRLAGTENWKTKYLPEPPMVSITQSVPGRIVTMENLRQLGLLAEEPVQQATRARTDFTKQSQSRSAKPWPSYELCLAGAPPNKAGTGPSRSHADYWFCYLAIQWGRGIEQAAEKLLEVSEKARYQAEHNDPGYALVTSQNAAADCERDKRNRSRA
jgi:hypothetical protein